LGVISMASAQRHRWSDALCFPWQAHTPEASWSAPPLEHHLPQACRINYIAQNHHSSVHSSHSLSHAICCLEMATSGFGNVPDLVLPPRLRQCLIHKEMSMSEVKMVECIFCGSLNAAGRFVVPGAWICSSCVTLLEDPLSWDSVGCRA